MCPGVLQKGSPLVAMLWPWAVRKDTEGRTNRRTVSCSYFRQAVNSLCETIMSKLWTCLTSTFGPYLAVAHRMCAMLVTLACQTCQWSFRLVCSFMKSWRREKKKPWRKHENEDFLSSLDFLTTLTAVLLKTCKQQELRSSKEGFVNVLAAARLGIGTDPAIN